MDSLVSSSTNSLEAKAPEQDLKQAAEVPCIAQDLEQEIAELEQQALSSGSLASDFGVFDDDMAYDGATSLDTSGVDQQHSAHLSHQGWQQLTRKHDMPSLTVEVQPRCNADDLLDSARGSSYAGGRPGDITPSSEDDACTHISGSFSSPKSIATHFTSAATFLPESVPITSSPSALYRTINLARKPARQSDRFKPSIPSALHAHPPPGLPCPPSPVPALPASSTPHSSLEAVSEAGSDASSESMQAPPPAQLQQQQLKRSSSSSAQLASPVSKVARLERPRREGAGTHSHGAACSNPDAAGAGRGCTALALGHLCGKKGAEGRALAVKGKAKGGKAGAGSPRGKKRGTGKCAPPAPGVHACSQCGAQSTPVWRAGPYGPKTLCNACGVRYMKIAKRK